MQARVDNGRSLSPLKRAQIIRAGKTVFLARGFGAASVDDIAAKAGVSKMTVYRHFRSKELLFAGVIDALCRQIMEDRHLPYCVCLTGDKTDRIADRCVIDARECRSICGGDKIDGGAIVRAARSHEIDHGPAETSIFVHGVRRRGETD